MNNPKFSIIILSILVVLIACSFCIKALKHRNPCKQNEVFFRGKCYVPGVEHVAS